MGPPLGLNILNILKKYGPGVSIGFLAEALGRHPSEIEAHLRSLEVEGVVKRSGDTVFLASQEQKHPAASGRG